MALFSCCTDFKGPAHPLCILAWPVPLQNYFSEITNQFYNWQGSLDGGLAGRKATTYTGQHHRNIKTCHESDSNPRSKRSSPVPQTAQPLGPVGNYNSISPLFVMWNEQRALCSNVGVWRCLMRWRHSVSSVASVLFRTAVLVQNASRRFFFNQDLVLWERSL
jgi:hypothetical protein